MLWIAFESVRHLNFSSMPMASIKATFRIAALFLLAFALVPLLVVHTRLANGLSPAIPADFQQPSLFFKVTSTATFKHPTSKSDYNNDSAIIQAEFQHPPGDELGSNRTIVTSQSEERAIGTSDSHKNSWINGCHPIPSDVQNTQKGPPTGLLVVLAVASDEAWVRRDALQRICHAIPTQIDYFLEPQSLDMLFLIEEEGLDWTMEKFVSCWGLQQLEDAASRTWQNLDGTTLTATTYHSPGNGKTKIFLARTKLEYPHYIQKDQSILSQPITPRSCQAPRKYIQATRWYTRELLHLGILKEYDYFLKIDTDILFLDTIPFHILQDMANRNAIFGHTAEYHPKGSKTCAQGIQQAMINFTETVRNTNTQDLPSWKGSLCTNSPEVQRDTDQYYTNFIIGKVSFWQSPMVLEWSNFLNEFPRGFFTYRWTDQIFWHYAMGLFLENYQDHVIDYTNLRCMPHPNCWLSSYNFQRYGRDAWHNCDNGGFFVHPKDFRIVNSKKKEPIRHSVWNVSQPLFQSTYQKDCSIK
jgi:hypothetical protein